jgi:hypothetical protein
MKIVPAYRWKLIWLLAGLCSVASAQDIGVAWTDPQLTALASTYDKLFSTTWSGGIDAGIGVQANPGDIAVVDDPVIAGKKAIRV